MCEKVEATMCNGLVKVDGKEFYTLEEVGMSVSTMLRETMIAYVTEAGGINNVSEFNQGVLQGVGAVVKSLLEAAGVTLPDADQAIEIAKSLNDPTINEIMSDLKTNPWDADAVVPVEPVETNNYGLYL